MTMLVAVIPFGMFAQGAQDAYAVADDIFSKSYAELNDDSSIFEVLAKEPSADELFKVDDLLLADPDFEVQENMISYTKDQKTVFFSANKKLKVDKNDESGVKIKKSVQLHLFKADVKENGDWVNLEMLPFNSTKHSTGHPALNEDDTKLYFVSDGPESIGKTDIFVIDLHEDGTYGEPENLGSKINSLEREVFPYMDKESVLYFASDVRTKGEKLDVFATRVVDDEPGIPVALDVPFSSDKEDYVAAYRTLYPESMRLVEEGPEVDAMTPAEVNERSSAPLNSNVTSNGNSEAEDQRDLAILSEAERFSGIAHRENADSGPVSDQVYDFGGDRIVYTVQIGAFLDRVNQDVYRDVSGLFSHAYDDGYNRFYSGIFDSEEEARAHLEQMQKDGFSDAFVLSLKGNKRYLPK